jgi:hypothetical protein
MTRDGPTYLDFLGAILREEVGAKQRKRISDGHHHRALPHGEDGQRLRLEFQPSVDQKLVRELAVDRYVANAENVLIFGPPGVGKRQPHDGAARAGVRRPVPRERTADAHLGPARSGTPCGTSRATCRGWESASAPVTPTHTAPRPSSTALFLSRTSLLASARPAQRSCAAKRVDAARRRSRRRVHAPAEAS